MPDPTGEFFDQLARRGHERLLEEMDATMRFDLTSEKGTEYWFVTIKHGDVRVSRETLPADCIVHTDRAVFDRMVTGHTVAQVAWLLRLLWVDGNLVLLRIFERIFPGPPTAHDPRDLVSPERRRR